MRLDKLTIGSAKNSPTHQFKNLKNVTIDFDQDHWVTVVIGWNGTGKSNVLEALAIKRLFELVTRDPAHATDFKAVAARLRRAIDRETAYSGDMHFLLRGQRSDAHPWIQELLEA